MFSLQVRLLTTLFQLSDSLKLGKTILFPEASSLDGRDLRVTDELRRVAEILSDRQDAINFHRRHVVGDATIRTIEIPVEPRRGRVEWRDPISVRAHACVWEEDGILRASLPLFGIDAVARDEKSLNERMVESVRIALTSARVAQSLRTVVLLPTPDDVKIHETTFSMVVKSPKQLAREQRQGKEESTLAEIGEERSKLRLPPAFCRQDLLDKLAELVLASNPSSVLLVGDSGVGKTAIVDELVRTRYERNFRFRTCWFTSGSRIVSGMSGFGAWQERCDQLCEEVRQEDVLLHLGNLFELMEVGQHVGSDQGIGDYLASRIASRQITCIAECTVQQLDEIQRRNPRMLDAFERIDVPSTNDETTREILSHVAEHLTQTGWSRGELSKPASHNDSKVTAVAIETIQRLHRRYATYSASPGRVVRFLTDLIEKIQDPAAIDETKITDAFSQQTGLPRRLLDDSVPLDLDESRRWFQRRVIGQEPATDCIVDMLATIKSAMSRPGKPIASLLFIGPTGVGKTEMAKSLAEFIYQDPGRMIRIDMSEFSDGFAAERLAGSNWQQEGILTSRVREQPFGVVLLDEFEKGHADVFDLLLQILGEGRLTDSVGRIADFSNSVVIMTSNLGADSAQKSNVGFVDSQHTVTRLLSHYQREAQKFLRPEIYNRIDHIVPFAPLSRDTVLRIVNSELGNLQARAMNHLGLQIDFGDGVAERLAEQSFEPLFGARPIKRNLERLMLAPIAAEVNRDTRTNGAGVLVSLDDERFRVTWKSAMAQNANDVSERRKAVLYATNCMQLRRETHKITTHFYVQDLRNELIRLKPRKKTKQPEKFTEALRRRMARIQTIEKLLSEIEETSQCVHALEERALLNNMDDAAVREGDCSYDDLRLYSVSNLDLMTTLYADSEENNDPLVLTIFGPRSNWQDELAECYRSVCNRHGMSSKTFFIIAKTANQKQLPKNGFPLAPKSLRDLWRQHGAITDIELFALPAKSKEVSQFRNAIVGIGIEISGPLKSARFEAESGVHQSIGRGNSKRAIVEFSECEMKAYEPRPIADLRSDAVKNPVGRTINLDKQVIVDRLQSKEFEFKKDEWQDAFSRLIEEQAVRRVKSWFGILNRRK